MTSPSNSFLTDILGEQGEKLESPVSVRPTKYSYERITGDGASYKPYDRLINLNTGPRTSAKTVAMLREAKVLSEAGFSDVYKEFNLLKEAEDQQKAGIAVIKGVATALMPFAAPQQVIFGAMGSLTDIAQGQWDTDKFARGLRVAGTFATFGQVNPENVTRAIWGKELVTDWGMKGTPAAVTGFMLDIFADPLLVGGLTNMAGKAARAGRLGEGLTPSNVTRLENGVEAMSDAARIEGAQRKPVADAFQRLTSLNDVVDNVAAGAISNPAAFRRAAGEILRNPLRTTTSIPGLFSADARYAGSPWSTIRENFDLAAGVQQTLSTLNAAARIPFSPAPIKQAWQTIPLSARMAMGEKLGSVVETARFIPTRFGQQTADTLTVAESVISRWGTIPGIPSVNIQKLIETGQTAGAGISRVLQDVFRQRQIEGANITMRATDLAARYGQMTRKMDDMQKRTFDYLATKVLDAKDPARLVSAYDDFERHTRALGIEPQAADFLRRVTDYDVYGATVRARIGIESASGVHAYEQGQELLEMIVRGDRQKAQDVVNQWLEFSVNPSFNNVMVTGYRNTTDQTGKVIETRPIYNPAIKSPFTFSGKKTTREWEEYGRGAAALAPAPTGPLPPSQIAPKYNETKMPDTTRIYHGTATPFDDFDFKMQTSKGVNGVFFAEDRAIASKFSETMGSSSALSGVGYKMELVREGGIRKGQYGWEEDALVDLSAGAISPKEFVKTYRENGGEFFTQRDGGKGVRRVNDEEAAQMIRKGESEWLLAAPKGANPRIIERELSGKVLDFTNPNTVTDELIREIGDARIEPYLRIIQEANRKGEKYTPEYTVLPMSKPLRDYMEKNGYVGLKQKDTFGSGGGLYDSYFITNPEAVLPPRTEGYQKSILELPADMRTPAATENPFPSTIADSPLLSSTKVGGKTTTDFIKQTIPVVGPSEVAYGKAIEDRFTTMLSGYKAVDGSNDAQIERIRSLAYAAYEDAQKYGFSVGSPAPFIPSRTENGQKIVDMAGPPQIYVGSDNKVYVTTMTNDGEMAFGQIVERGGQLRYWGASSETGRVKAQALEEARPVDPELRTTMNEGSGGDLLAYGPMRYRNEEIREGNELGVFDDEIQKAKDVYDFTGSRSNTQVDQAELMADAWDAKVNSIFESKHVEDIKVIYPDQINTDSWQNIPRGEDIIFPDKYNYDGQIMFHGGSVPYGNLISDVSPKDYAKSSGNLFGPGDYLTDSAPIAAGYFGNGAGNRGGPVGDAIFAVRMRGPMKTFNLERLPKDAPAIARLMEKKVMAQVTSDEERIAAQAYFAALKQAADRKLQVEIVDSVTLAKTTKVIPDDAVFQILPAADFGAGRLLTEGWKVLQMPAPPVPAKGYNGLFDKVGYALHDSLLERGYQAMRHVGGKRVGQSTHLHNVMILLGQRGDRPKVATVARSYEGDGFVKSRDSMTDKPLTEGNTKTLGVYNAGTDKTMGFDPTIIIQKRTAVGNGMSDPNMGTYFPPFSVGVKRGQRTLPLTGAKLARDGDDLVVGELMGMAGVTMRDSRLLPQVQQEVRAALANSYAIGYREASLSEFGGFGNPVADRAREIIDGIPGASIIERPNGSYAIEMDARIIADPDALFRASNPQKVFNTVEDGNSIARAADRSLQPGATTAPKGPPAGGFATSDGRKYRFNSDDDTVSIWKDGMWQPGKASVFAAENPAGIKGHFPPGMGGIRVALTDDGSLVAVNPQGAISVSIPTFDEPRPGSYIVTFDSLNSSQIGGAKSQDIVGMELGGKIEEMGPNVSFVNEKGQYGRQVSTAENPFAPASATRDPNSWNPDERLGAKMHLRRSFMASENPREVLKRIDLNLGARVTFDTERLEKAILDMLVIGNRTDTTAREVAERFQSIYKQADQEGKAPIDFVPEFFAAEGFGKAEIAEFFNRVGREFWRDMGISWRPPGEELASQMLGYLSGNSFSGAAGGARMQSTSRAAEKGRQDLPDYWQEALIQVDDLAEVIRKSAEVNEKVVTRRGLVSEMHSFLKAEGGIIPKEEAPRVLGYRTQGWTPITAEMEAALKGIKEAGEMESHSPFKQGDLIPHAYAQQLAMMVTTSKPGLGQAMLQYLNARWKMTKVGTVAGIVRDSGGNFALASAAGVTPFDMARGFGMYARLMRESKKAGQGMIDLIDERAAIQLSNGEKVSVNEMLEAGDFLHSGFFFQEVSEPLSQLAKELTSPSGNPFQQFAGGMVRFFEGLDRKIGRNDAAGVAATAGQAAVGLATGLPSVVNKFLGDKKGMVDMGFKGAMYLLKREQGMPPAAAAKFADEVFFNYQNVPFVVDALRRSGISPFAAFQFLSAGRFIKTLYENPYALHRVYRIPGSIRQTVGEEEYDREFRATADYVKKGLWIPKFDFSTREFVRDSEGRTQWLHLGGFLPETATMDMFMGGPGGAYSAAASPTWELMSALITGSGYQGADTYPGGNTLVEALRAPEPIRDASTDAAVRVLWQHGVAPFAPGSPMTERLANSIEQSWVNEDQIEDPQARKFMEFVVEYMKRGPAVSLKQAAEGRFEDADKMPSRTGSEGPQDFLLAVQRFLGVTGVTSQADPSKPGSMQNNKMGQMGRFNDLEKAMLNEIRSTPPSMHDKIREKYRKAFDRERLRMDFMNQNNR